MTENSLEQGQVAAADIALSSPEIDSRLDAMLADPAIDLLQLEAEKVKGAIRTDFVLSAEIIAITLGTVATAAFSSQLVVLVAAQQAVQPQAHR